MGTGPTTCDTVTAKTQESLCSQGFTWTIECMGLPIGCMQRMPITHAQRLAGEASSSFDAG